VAVGVVPDLRIPVTMDAQVRPGSALENRNNNWLAVEARLKPGMTIGQAQAATDVVFQTARELDVRKAGDSPTTACSSRCTCNSIRPGMAHRI
jgi:hypothetical protein